jgi:hypothetical protein
LTTEVLVLYIEKVLVVESNAIKVVNVDGIENEEGEVT